jgi:uncharacterized protein (DUF488 family)
MKTIYTIGHSTRSITEFIALLEAFSIKVLADVRNYPGSKRYPHFNKEALEHALKKHHILYVHIKDLGGRRRPVENSHNSAWRNESFRGYADYMETGEFLQAIKDLESFATKKNTAIMCSEAVWWSCHRAMISDYLKSTGWNVLHIMGIDKADEHPYTGPAKIIGGKLTYRSDSDIGPTLFD